MSKIIKSYNQLPPAVKQAINNTAAKAARSVVTQVQSRANRNRASQARSRTTRTRNGMRIYAPNDVIETKSVTPVSYATTWTSGNKSLRVHQTEVIGRVSANNTWFPSWNNNYSVATFPINPANPRTFPWLSYIARLYDKYRFHGLRFIYVNSVSTQQEGNVMLSLDYDTLDTAPSNLIEASQLAKYKLTPIYYPCDFAVPVNHPGNNPWLYTFDLAATSSSVDLKTYNLGNFFLALDGVPQDGKDYGYLAVEYDVELLDKNPITTDSVFASATYDSAAPVSKRDRSNVDPADTMEITTTWTAPSSAAESNPLTFTFSEDVPVGAKLRLAIYMKAEFKASSSSASCGFGSFMPVTSDATVLYSDSLRRTLTTSGDTTTTAAYVNFDITVPESRSVSFTVSTSGYCKFTTSTSSYATQVMAYTYA